MLYKKKGFPEDSEIVLCTVTKVQSDSVFVTLDEYDRSGIINIAEISPGRIRNIRDFVREGKKSVCKILRVNSVSGHIDLSLRRVTESQKRAKNDEIKHEQMAEKIVEIITNEAKMPVRQVYEQIMKGCQYDHLYTCFEEVANDKFSLEKTGLDANTVKKLTEIIKLRIKPPEVVIGGSLAVSTYAPDGVETIKEAFKKGQAKNVSFTYMGGGRYKVKVVSDEYKKAEEILKKSTDAVLNFAREKGCEGNFARAKAEK